MFDLSIQSVEKAGIALFERTATDDERAALHRREGNVDELEQAIRKQLTVHLAVRGNEADIPFCLRLMSLVKDVERVGDYAIDLLSLSEHRQTHDADMTELLGIRAGVERALRSTQQAWTQSEFESANNLVGEIEDLVVRAESFIIKLPRLTTAVGDAVFLTLAAQYYKRITRHAGNVLTSVTMPVHMLDHYDEAAVLR